MSDASDRYAVKAKHLGELQKWAAAGMAEDLKSKFAPKTPEPAPAPERKNAPAPEPSSPASLR